MVLTENRRQTLTTTSRLRLALTPAMKQSLQLMAWRNHQITRFVRDLAADNPFLDVNFRNCQASDNQKCLLIFRFHPGWLKIGLINRFMRI